jgi:hypothetical protein
VRIIAMSGGSMASDGSCWDPLVPARALCADHILNKRFRLETLRSAIEMTLREAAIEAGPCEPWTTAASASRGGPGHSAANRRVPVKPFPLQRRPRSSRPLCGRKHRPVPGSKISLEVRNSGATLSTLSPK